MSERRMWALLLTCVAITTPLRAQEVDRLDRQERRLEARLAELRSEAVAAREAEFSAQARTVVSIGGVHVAYPAWAATEARSRLPGMLAERHTRYGRMIDSLLTDTLFIWVEDSAQATGKWTAHGEWRLGGIRDSLFIDLDPELRLDWATWAVGQALERWAQRVLDPALVSWTGPTGPRVSVDALRDGALHDLVTSPSSLARRCAEGDLDRCRRLLDLNAAGDTGISSYDAADLPRLVESSGTAEYLPGRAECVVQLDLARCGELIRDHHLAIPWAATARVRQSLFAFALATGGQDAWLRLQRAAGRSISAQLAAGADRPIDGLIAAWQHDLRSEHRSTTAGLGDALMLAITWSVVGTLLFAWRFRWRRV